jgi:hypothetical protein
VAEAVGLEPTRDDAPTVFETAAYRPTRLTLPTSGRPDSNRRPLAPKASALPTALQPVVPPPSASRAACPPAFADSPGWPHTGCADDRLVQAGEWSGWPDLNRRTSPSRTGRSTQSELQPGATLANQSDTSRTRDQGCIGLALEDAREGLTTSGLCFAAKRTDLRHRRRTGLLP